MTTTLAAPTNVTMAVEPGLRSLLVRLRAGDSAAVAWLYQLHHDEIRSFARRLLGDAAAAEDLVHEVFVAVPGAIARFREEGSLRSFLLSIAVNLARRHVRAAARRRAALARAFAVEEDRAHEPGPDACLERRELADALHCALDALPVEQRVAFVLCVVEERPSAEAAHIADVPETTIRTRLYHARRRLRDLLKKRGIV